MSGIFSPETLDEAWSLLTAGQLDKAAGIAQSLTAAHAHDHRAWHLLSLVHAKRGRIADALSCIGQAVILEPKDVALRLQQGQYFIANGQRREAVDVAMSLSGSALPRADWNDALGTLFTLCDDPSRALPFLQLAVTQAPDDPRYRYNLAAVQRMTGDLARSRGDAEFRNRQATIERICVLHPLGPANAESREQSRWRDDRCARETGS